FRVHPTVEPAWPSFGNNILETSRPVCCCPSCHTSRGRGARATSQSQNSPYISLLGKPSQDFPAPVPDGLASDRAPILPAAPLPKSPVCEPDEPLPAPCSGAGSALRMRSPVIRSARASRAPPTRYG